MGENDLTFAKKSNMNVANADLLPKGGAKGLQAPPYKMDQYKDDKDKSDPMDLLGNHIGPNEILVPANASPAERFEYYHAILKTGGQEMKIKPGSTHILGLRGVVKDKAGNITQTASAARYQMALHGVGRIKDRHHFADSDSARKSPSRQLDTKDSEGTWNDLIIVLSVDQDNNKSAKENLGSVDPAKTGDSWGSAHLMDGTFTYGIGKHNTPNPDHKDVIKELEKNKEYMTHFNQWKKKKPGAKSKNENKKKKPKKETYNALVPISDLRILRDGIKKKRGLLYKDQEESTGFFTDEDIASYNENKKKHKEILQ